MSLPWRVAGWIVVLGLILAPDPWRGVEHHEHHEHHTQHEHSAPHGHDTIQAAPAPPLGPLGRLLGPFAALAASVQWLRVERDLAGGRFGRGYARAEFALNLDPRAAAGWSLLAHHLAFQRARPELEADPAARRAFVRAAIELLARGERRSADPARLAFEAGLILLHAAAYDEVESWPGGAAAALGEASLHFERAARLGHPLAAELAGLTRERAERTRGPR